MTFSGDYDDGLAKRNAAILFVAQSFYGASATILVTLGGLVGYSLASNKALATLPISFVVIGTLATTIPASLYMRRVGRRLGFMTGAALGIAGASLACFAIVQRNFVLFNSAMLLCGGYQGFATYYRFAAADVASAVFRPKAISFVMAGGVVAAILGPELVKLTKDLMLPIALLGSYATMIVLGVAAMAVLAFVRSPPPAGGLHLDRGRPILEIMRQPKFIAAAMCGMFGYGIMTLLMTATPLAMVACNLTVDDAAFVIQGHALAMFLPSFVTGSLIARFGVDRVIGTGGLLLAVCVAIAMSGLDLADFWLSLAVLGLGWNFTFIGASTLLTETYRPEELNKTQAANDFLVFGTAAMASLSSGGLLHGFGWGAVNIAAVPFITVILIAAAWLAIETKRSSVRS